MRAARAPARGWHPSCRPESLAKNVGRHGQGRGGAGTEARRERERAGREDERGVDPSSDRHPPQGGDGDAGDDDTAAEGGA